MIPVLDLTDYRAGAPGARELVAAQLRNALEEVGFFSVVGHGVTWDEVTEIYRWAARYHALPLEAKLAGGTLSPAMMGYNPMEGEQIPASDSEPPERRGADSTGRKPSLNAAFFMARPGSKRNQWPELAGFETACTAYYRLMDKFCHDWLLPLYAAALDLESEYFQRFFDPSLATLRLTHYPPADADVDQWGIDPHADAGYMTLLPSNPVAGLYVKAANGEWFEAAQEPESFIVNAGDTLHRWTNGRFRSTLHRVLNRSGGDRYAIPFFYDPRVDTVIECLPGCATADQPAQFDPITYRELLTTFMGNSYRTLREPAR